MPILDLSKMKVESKQHEIKTKATNAAKNTLQWAKENPELAALGAAGIGAAAKGLKSLEQQRLCHDQRTKSERREAE